MDLRRLLMRTASTLAGAGLTFVPDLDGVPATSLAVLAVLTTGGFSAALLGGLIGGAPAALLTAILTRSRSRWRDPLALALVPLGAAAAGMGGRPLLTVAGAAIIARLLVPGTGPARGLATIINTLCGWTFFTLSCVALALTGRWWVHPAVVRFGASGTIASAPLVAYLHRTPRSPFPASVVVANHASMLDILLAIAVPGRHRRIAAKAWVFHAPILGAAARRAGMIEATALTAGQPIPYLPSGEDLVIFPEGSRSRDGRVGLFHGGALHAARLHGRDLAVLTLIGTGRVMPPACPWIRPGILLARLDPGPAPGHDRTVLRQMRSRIIRRQQRYERILARLPLARLARREDHAQTGVMGWIRWWRSERAPCPALEMR